LKHDFSHGVILLSSLEEDHAMTQHSTNYYDTFIEVAHDCPVVVAVAPPIREPQSAARIEYEMVIDSPYRYTSDDVLYQSHGHRRGLHRDEFFSKGQPCMRASCLTKRYGWGIHTDAEGRIALVARESDDYLRLAADPTLHHLTALRSTKT
jgi:hypothetical protein